MREKSLHSRCLRYLWTVIAACAFCTTTAGTERNLLQKAATETRVRASIVCDRSWVPYPAYSDRTGWDAVTGKNKAELIARGERRLDFEWRIIRATDYLAFERSGNRKTMEVKYFNNTNALSDLLLAELAEGQGRFLDQIIDGVFYFCEMTSWAISAHQNMQLSGRALPDRNDPVIALFSSGTAALLAWTNHFLCEEFNRIDPIISTRIRHEIEDRILNLYMREDRFWWMAFRPVWAVNNWNPWCNSNVLQCFMLLEDDPNRLSEAVYRSMRSVDRFLNYIKSDGACEEGPGYWVVAAGKLFDYLQLLSWVTNDDVSVFGDRMIRNMGEYVVRSCIGDDWVVNFADASARNAGEAGLIYRYGKSVGSEEMIGFAALLNRQQNERLPDTKETHLLRQLEHIRCAGELSTVEPRMSDREFTWYPETQFCYMRSGRFFLATKGGHNNESHNHNDIGSFILCTDNRPVLLDAGVGTYTRQTFSTDRYSIWSMQSDYHNLPCINGFSQRNGETYAAADVRINERRRTFSCDLAGAYPAEAGIRYWRRGYELTKKALVVTDDFMLDAPSDPNILHFMTWGDVNIAQPGRVWIATPAGQRAVLIYDASVFEPSLEIIPLDDPLFTRVWGDRLMRLSLRARKVTRQASYRVTIAIAGQE